MKFEYSPYIAIPVRDNDKAIDFYRRVIGMDITESKGNDTYMKLGFMNFVFENDPDDAFKKVFFEFKVEDVKEAVNLLEFEGCSVLKTYNDKSVMLTDPFGMRFHIWEEGAFEEANSDHE